MISLTKWPVKSYQVRCAKYVDLGIWKVQEIEVLEKI
jgi:hypothetical protein